MKVKRAQGHGKKLRFPVVMWKVKEGGKDDVLNTESQLVGADIVGEGERDRCRVECPGHPQRMVVRP